MTRTYRNLAIVLALLATVLNATVLTWHAVARPTVTSAETRPTADLQFICHGVATPDGGLTANDGTVPRPFGPLPSPAPKAPDCPICQSMAALGQVILPQSLVAIVWRAQTRAKFVETDSIVADYSAATPRNRGPPLPA